MLLTQFAVVALSLVAPVPDKMPLTGLAPSKLSPDLCVLRYRVSTHSPECQAYFDQALGYYYSYVWMESARSFETATRFDPDCAMAWWGLSRAMEQWRHGDHTKALLKADALKDKTSHREQLLILARMQEKGQIAGVGNAEARKKAAIATLDDMLAMYDDDQEAWMARAMLAGGAGLFGGQASAVPFYKALLRINPLHPGANHELLHFYENFRRPALGWIYAENYIKSTPGIAHPFHMQAHLAMRIGRWDKTTDRSAHAIELERAYHKFQNVKPNEDWQYSHHLETLMRSLTHDGRFPEARAIKKDVWDLGWRHWDLWFRLHLAERDWDEAMKIVSQFRRQDKLLASYFAALVYLKQGEPIQALPEIEVLREAYQQKKNDRQLELRLWETQGWFMCQTGAADAGLRLLAKTVERTKHDYSHHSSGNGAYYMETWGIAALHAGKAEVAEEAFLEALAHDAGSLRAALGMQVLCERQGRSEEAERFAELARRCWKKAPPHALNLELAYLRGERITSNASSTRSEATTGLP